MAEKHRAGRPRGREDPGAVGCASRLKAEECTLNFGIRKPVHNVDDIAGLPSENHSFACKKSSYSDGAKNRSSVRDNFSF